ncbi:protein of unknown function [Rathayibacter oskolensis]|uniref:HNH nuclease domain-containing protein n=1 Tax=Rathayibacter oskolensis TaxID=1891671 RepID=A0A1X7MTV4_9MICO|nr:HNH endonuclease signature motif containing protein [Rathayibacter oskolensis]SMH28235.1 protein of unknown function [Rathayibacter oskolensis]
MAGIDSAEAALAEVRGHGDRAAELARSAAPLHLASAEALYAGYRAATATPESFARGLSRSETEDLVERSIRAEFAVALGVSERVATRELEHAQLLVEHLPLTRAALAAARLRWEAGQAICTVADTLPVESRAAFDERATELAVSVTPTRLRQLLARLRDELHAQPLAERHARAREDRAVWLTPDFDGMATLCAFVPAPAAVGAFDRLDRIARALRDDADGSGDQRTLAQLRADALADLLSDGDVAGTTPISDPGEPPATFVPGVRAEVRLTLPASTAAGLDDTAADLDGYGLIPAEVARNLVGVGTSFTAVVTDPSTGTVVSVGRTHRVPPPRMRLLLQLRDQTCRFPGCTRTAARAEADHTVEWRNGGSTALENLASLCVAHHHVRHGDRWTYVLHPDGTADWTTPTGRRVTTRPPVLPGSPAAPPPRPRFHDAPPPFRHPEWSPADAVLPDPPTTAGSGRSVEP